MTHQLKHVANAFVVLETVIYKILGVVMIALLKLVGMYSVLWL